MVEDDVSAESDRPTTPEETPARPWFRRPWLLGVGGAVVVALVIVVVSVSAAQQASPGSDAGAAQPVTSGSATAPGGDPAGPSDAAPTDPASSDPASSDPASSDPASADPGAVPSAPVEAAPVPIDAPATAIPGLVFAISDMTSVEGTASAVGEVAGPSIQFTLTATNSTGDPISLETTVVNVTYGDAKTPADALSTGSVPIPPVVGAGAGAAGTYIFNVPLDQRGALRIQVDYQTGTPIVVFEGAGPA